MIRFEVQENVTEYLTKLTELVSDESNTVNFLKDAGSELHFRYIEPNMPKWNPNLMYSPLEPDHRKTEVNEDKSFIELLYTGFTESAKMNDLPEGVWSEFGDKAQGILERDYAYFQETTKDPVAEPKDAKSPFFVKTGTATYTTEFHYKTMAYVDQLMQLKRWRRVTVFRDLYDYME